MSIFDDLLNVDCGDVIQIHGRDLIVQSITRSAASKRYHCKGSCDEVYYDVEHDAKHEMITIDVHKPSPA